MDISNQMECECYGVGDDPLEVLHINVVELIFQHFSWHEVLSASTVSQLWYDTIAESPNCMKKLKINILKRHANRCDLQEMEMHVNVLISSRQYRNIYADFSHQNSCDLLKVLSGRNWKDVHLLNSDFDDGEFLTYFCDTVEGLTLQRISCGESRSNKGEANRMTFPRLQQLVVQSCNGALLSDLECCTNLKELCYSEKQVNHLDEKQNIKNLLTNNRKLEKLTIFSQTCELSIPSEIHFNLTRLSINSMNGASSDDNRRCLREFLLSQSATLEVVDLSAWSGVEVLEICLRMPKLTDLSCSLRHNGNLNLSNARLSRNHSLTRLSFRDIDSRESISTYDAMFDCTPNLRVFKAENMCLDDLISLSLRCRELQELYIENFNVALLPSENCLPKLTKFKSWDVHDELIKSIKAKGAKNLFEELILSY